MDETKKRERATNGTAIPTPLIGDTAIVRDGGSMERNEEPITEYDIITEMIDSFSGYGIIGKCVGRNKTNAYRHITQTLKLKTLREFDEAWISRDTTYNADFKRDQLTHAMDFYRLSNGSIQRKHHSRGNVKFEGESILLGIITNLRTGKIYYNTWLSDDETEIKALDLIDTVKRIEGENVKAIQSDRYLKDLTAMAEKVGITMVCYGKDYEHPYNSRAEQPFTNISKQFYLMLGIGYGHITKQYGRHEKERINYYRNLLKTNQFGGLTKEDGLRLFNSILEIHYNNNAIPLVKTKRYLRAKRLEIIQTQTHTQTKKEKDEI